MLVSCPREAGHLVWELQVRARQSACGELRAKHRNKERDPADPEWRAGKGRRRRRRAAPWAAGGSGWRRSRNELTQRWGNTQIAVSHSDSKCCGGLARVKNKSKTLLSE